VIHQPLYRPKQIRAGEYAVGRKIGLERVKSCMMKCLLCPLFHICSDRDLKIFVTMLL
jgi:hypothetical protein